MVLTRDGRYWRIGTAQDVDWIARGVIDGPTVTQAVPTGYDAYATTYRVEEVDPATYEGTLVRVLADHTPDQPWWLGYLDTGAHDVVAPAAPRVPLYWAWGYVLVEAGPEQALTWRRGHMRGDGWLPDLFFPVDRSFLVSALWDDVWTCVGGSEALVAALVREPALRGRRVTAEEDALPPGLTRE